jgi:hypothetical protein
MTRRVNTPDGLHQIEVIAELYRLAQWSCEGFQTKQFYTILRGFWQKHRNSLIDFCFYERASVTSIKISLYSSAILYC